MEVHGSYVPQGIKSHKYNNNNNNNNKNNNTNNIMILIFSTKMITYKIPQTPTSFSSAVVRELEDRPRASSFAMAWILSRCLERQCAWKNLTKLEATRSAAKFTVCRRESGCMSKKPSRSRCWNNRSNHCLRKQPQRQWKWWHRYKMCLWDGLQGRPTP